MYRCIIKAVLSAAIISILTLRCGETVWTPPNAEEYASFIMEYDCMTGMHIPTVTGDSNILQHVIDAFDDVGLGTEIKLSQGDLPAYADYDTTWEYDYFPNNDQLLRDYAAAFDNNDLPWHSISVDKYEENNNGLYVYGRAASLNRGVHLPPTPAEERYSMVFTQDIVDAYTEWYETDLIPAVLVTTAIHELGHQRAGLTCSNTWAHTQECVMSGYSNYSLGPRFCRTIEDSLWQTTHCLENIEANYGNF